MLTGLFHARLRKVASQEAAKLLDVRLLGAEKLGEAQGLSEALTKNAWQRYESIFTLPKLGRIRPAFLCAAALGEGLTRAYEDKRPDLGVVLAPAFLDAQGRLSALSPASLSTLERIVFQQFLAPLQAAIAAENPPALLGAGPHFEEVGTKLLAAHAQDQAQRRKGAGRWGRLARTLPYMVTLAVLASAVGAHFYPDTARRWSYGALGVEGLGLEESMAGSQGNSEGRRSEGYFEAYTTQQVTLTSAPDGQGQPLYAAAPLTQLYVSPHEGYQVRLRPGAGKAFVDKDKVVFGSKKEAQQFIGYYGSPSR